MLPQTEAMRQGIEALNDVKDDAMHQLLAAAMSSSDDGATDTASPSSSMDHIPLMTLRFLLSQLAFFGMSDVATVTDALSSVVAPSVSNAGAPQQLSAEWVRLLTERWLDEGKHIVQRHREAAVASLCQTPHRLEDRSLLVQATVGVCSGHATEGAPEASGEFLSVDYALKQNEHAPAAIVSLPPTQQCSSRTALTLPLDAAYVLFQTIDTIQLAMDRVVTGTVAA